MPLAMSGSSSEGSRQTKSKSTRSSAGVSGNKSNDMLNRLDKDVISKRPNFMTLSCGVNDVAHGVNGIPLDKYKENVTAMLDKAQAADIKGRDPDSDNVP